MWLPRSISMRTATLWSFLVPIDKVVERARSIRPDLLIVSRVRDADHARHLYAIGATDAVLRGRRLVRSRRRVRQAILRGRAVTGATSIAPRQPPLDSALAELRGANTRTRQAS